MKLEKIYNEVTKAITKEQKIYIDFLEDDYIFITIDSFKGYILKDEEFIFRANLFTQRGIAQSLSNKDYIPADKTNDIKILDERKLKVVCISNGDIDVLVNEKYLSNFDNTANFMIKGKYNPVLVYENGFLRGLIMPVIMEV